jgi:zinc protease
MRTLLYLMAAAVLGQQPPPRPPAAPGAKPAASAAQPSYQDLKFPPLRPITVPPLESVTLPNGLRLYLLEDHELPLVEGVALVRTGTIFDPPGKTGLATITGIVLRSGGTAQKAGEQIDEQLDNMAASIESQTGRTYASVTVSAVKESAGEVLSILRDLLTAPAFRQDAIDQVKAQLRNSVARRNDNAAAAASRELAVLIYGRDTPQGAVLEYEHLDRIGRDDVVAFYQRHYFPANIMLALRGDFSAPEMRAAIEKLFGGWNARQEPVPQFPQVQSKPAPGIYAGEKKDVTEAYFAMGHLAGQIRDKDFAAAQVMAEILGGGTAGRLYQRLRTSAGAGYAVSASWDADYAQPGLFVISGRVRPLAVLDTPAGIEAEIERLRQEPVPAHELEFARQRVLNKLAFAFDTGAEAFNRLLMFEYYGYPKDFLEQHQKAIAAVTAAQVQAAARERLKPAELVMAVIGNPADFGRATANLTVTSLDLRIKEARPVPAASSPESLKKGKELLQLAQRAVGGADKLSSIQNVTEISEFEVDPVFGGMTVKQTQRWLGDSVYRQDSEMAGGRINAYWDGKAGWLSTPQGTGPLPPLQQKQAQGEVFRMFFRLLLSDRRPGLVVNHVGGGTLEIGDAADNFVRLIVDEKTGLPQKLTYLGNAAGGPPAAMEEVFLSFMEVQGVKAPARVAVRQNGRPFAEVRVTEYRFNTEMRPADLAKRP